MGYKGKAPCLPEQVLTHPKTLGDDAVKSLQKSWRERYGGQSGAHVVVVLEEGMTIEPQKTRTCSYCGGFAKTHESCKGCGATS